MLIHKEEIMASIQTAVNFNRDFNDSIIFTMKKLSISQHEKEDI
jgi:hypothetical protein